MTLPARYDLMAGAPDCTLLGLQPRCQAAYELYMGNGAASCFMGSWILPCALSQTALNLWSPGFAAVLWLALAFTRVRSYIVYYSFYLFICLHNLVT